MDPSGGSYAMEENLPRANRFRDITLGHLDKFIGGEYRSQNLSSVLYEGRDDSESAVHLEVWSAPNLTKPTFSEATHQQYTRIKKGFKFGPSWSNHWVRATLTIRKEWQDKERVQFEFDPGCEAMIYTSEGLPLQGITGGNDKFRRVEFIIPQEERFRRVEFVIPQQERYNRITIYIEVSANAMFGVPNEGTTEVQNDVYFELALADIVVPRQEAWHLMWDYRVILDMAKSLPVTNPSCLKAQSVAMEISNTFKPDDLPTIMACRKIAEKILGPDWSIKDVYDAKSDWNLEGDAEGVPVLSMGNCHIDTAWLWPFSVTQQKIARSWATQIDLIQRYPEFRFIASQPQQFKWLEELYPQLFSKVRKEVENGRFHITGGSWVENDTNMPSGEALCRQFVYGQRFFKSRFGKYTDVLWLPDSFGFSAQMPQICRLAGIPYFFTQKLSWSQFNRFPHSSFNWIGIDGTQILAHMTPVDTYNSQASLEELIKAISNHKNLEWCDKSLMVYGNGDGGGGPLVPMIESLRRLRAAANNAPSSGIPKVTQGYSVSDFYRMLLKRTRNGKDLPTWRGELYLEYHRGTYTSHGSIKKHNRRSEILMREIEYFATLASLSDKDTGYTYPKDALDSLWEIVLLCQFHDVLPGSAIAKVYVDVEKLYAEVAQKGAALLEAARQAVMAGSLTFGLESVPRGGIFLGLNTLSFPRQEVLRIPLDKYDGRSAFSISEEDGDFGFTIAKDNTGNSMAELESLSTLRENIKLATASTVSDAMGQVSYVMANASLTVRVSDLGRIVSITDTELGRELILPRTTAGFVIYEDQPIDFDAWEVDIFHLDTKTLIDAVSVKVIEPKGLRASLLVECVYNKSKITTTISLDAVPMTLKADALSLIRFDTVVDWHEEHKFLKFELPLDINADQATYEIQYGTLQRSTHKNTSWDAAKFEVCGHKFADLSEFGYGVAILNDCKYGYSCEGSYLRLSLLRAATIPDPKQDRGLNEMSFAILPHRGHFLESEVPQAAIAFNNPLHLRYMPTNGTALPAISCKALAPFTKMFKLSGLGSRNVFLDTVKRGEHDTFGVPTEKPIRTVILRMYEAFGGSTKVDLTTILPLQEAYIVDVLERHLVQLKPCGQQEQTIEGSVMVGTTFKLRFKAFQILTIKFIL